MNIRRDFKACNNCGIVSRAEVDERDKCRICRQPVRELTDAEADQLKLQKETEAAYAGALKRDMENASMEELEAADSIFERVFSAARATLQQTDVVKELEEQLQHTRDQIVASSINVLRDLIKCGEVSGEWAFTELASIIAHYVTEDDAALRETAWNIVRVSEGRKTT